MTCYDHGRTIKTQSTFDYIDRVFQIKRIDNLNKFHLAGTGYIFDFDNLGNLTLCRYAGTGIGLETGLSITGGGNNFLGSSGGLPCSILVPSFFFSVTIR